MKPKEQNKPKKSAAQFNNPLGNIKSYQDLINFAKNKEESSFYTDGKKSEAYQNIKKDLNYLESNKDNIKIYLKENSKQDHTYMVLVSDKFYEDQYHILDIFQLKPIHSVDHSVTGMIGYSHPRFLNTYNLFLLSESDVLFKSNGIFSRYIKKLEFNKNCKTYKNMGLTGFRSTTKPTSDFQFTLDHFLLMMERSPEGFDMANYPEWVKIHIEMYQNSQLLK